MRAYSIDLRVRVIEAYNRKEGSIRELAKRFSIHWRTVANWTKRFKSENTVGPRIQKYGPDKIITEDKAKTVEDIIKGQPDLNAQEVRDKFEVLTDIKVSRSTIWRELNRQRLSFKKKHPQQMKLRQNESGIYSENMQK